MNSVKRWGSLRFRGLFFGGILLASSISWGASVCQSERTQLHYAKTECRETLRPTGDGQTFAIKSMKILAMDPDPSSRPTLILIPGGPGESAGGLRSLLEAKDLLNAFWYHLKFNVIIFDPRGTGESLLPGQPEDQSSLTNYNTMNLKLLVDDFAAVLEDYQLDKVVLFSHSFGAFTAAKYAELYPEKVERIVMSSPMASARGLGLVNVMMYGESFPVISQHLSYLDDSDYKDQVREAFRLVETVFFQQLKAQITGVHKLESFNGVSIPKLRKEILKRLGDIRTPSPELLEYLVELSNSIKVMSKTDTLVTPELRNAKVSADQLITARFTGWRIITNQIVCNEGIMEHERTMMSFYDGVPFGHRCSRENTKYQPSIPDPILENITAPVLILTGDLDTQVPLYLQQDLAAKLPKSTQVRFANEGHFPGLVDSMGVFNALEDFLLP